MHNDLITNLTITELFWQEHIRQQSSINKSSDGNSDGNGNDASNDDDNGNKGDGRRKRVGSGWQERGVGGGGGLGSNYLGNCGQLGG